MPLPGIYSVSVAWICLINTVARLSTNYRSLRATQKQRIISIVNIPAYSTYFWVGKSSIIRFASAITSVASLGSISIPSFSPLGSLTSPFDENFQMNYIDEREKIKPKVGERCFFALKIAGCADQWETKNTIRYLFHQT